MNISRKWLSDYINIECDDATLCERLTMAGIEVEAIESTSTIPNTVVAAEILSREPHPDSDHLSVCRVFDGSSELQIVCGAPNCDAGAIVPLAPIGTVFSTPEGEFKIKKSKLRGVESHGMLCSAAELGISDDHSGLLILDAATAPGTPLTRLYPGDAKIEIEVTPNRPDWLSIWGVARDLECLLDTEAKLPEVELEDNAPEIPGLVTVEEPELCPRYIGRVIEGVKIGPSPEWIVKRLESVGMRSINNVVDVTNFILMELGQPLHAFDRDKLAGGRVVARRARAGEKIVTLDGSQLELSPDNLVIADAEKPMALAGIMGGEYSGVSDETTSILLETAIFNRSCIRATSRKLGIASDSSYRYERGVDAGMAEYASRRAAQLIIATAGGHLASAPCDVAVPQPAHPEIRCRFQRVRELIGSEVSNERMVEIFRRLRLEVREITAESCIVIPPTFRGDIEREADLVEEVARVDGLDKIPLIRVAGKCCHPSSEDAFSATETLRDRVIAAGFRECIHYSIVGKTTALLDSRFSESDLVTLDNPLSQEIAVMRPSLLGVMLDAAERNLARGNRDLALFELDTCFCANPKLFPEERRELMLLLTGLRHPERYSDERREVLDFYDLKGRLESILAAMKIGDIRFKPLDGDRRYRPGHAAEVIINGRSAGTCGEIAAELAAGCRTTMPIFIAVIEPGVLATAAAGARSYKALELYPSISRDIAFVADAKLDNGAIRDFIRRCKVPHLESVEIFDVFTDPALEAAGRRSLAYTLSFRHRERTLTDVEINAAVEKLRARLAAELGVELR